jgi:hypothetical protein
LAGQVEQKILALHQIIHRILIAHIGDIDLDAILNAGDIAQIAAVDRDQRIDQRGARAQLNQPARQHRADEAKAAGDQHACIVESVCVIVHTYEG